MNNPIIDKFGTKRWFNKDDQLHRENDQPAIVYADGTKYWYKNGQIHRGNDQPAIVYADGTKFWYKNGIKQPNPELLEIDWIKEGF